MLGLLAHASPVLAQSDEQRANARALADQGAQAFSEARWQDAIDFFDRAESLLDAPTHLLFSARAHAKLHHYVKARELYLRIIRTQLAENAPRAFKNAQTSANEELSDVVPHIGQLTIVLRGPEPKTAKVTLDGAPMQSVLIGVSRPIDPGTHQVQADAPGFSAQTKEVSVPDGGKASVTIELPRGETPPSEPATPVTTPSASEPTSAPLAPYANDASASTDVKPSSTSNGKKIASYAAFGVGAVGLGAGAFFLAGSASKRSQADKKFQECGGATGCTNENPLSGQVDSLDQSARSAQTLAIVGFAVGATAVGTGVVLLLLGKHPAKSQSGLSVSPVFGLGSAGLRGSF